MYTAKEIPNQGLITNASIIRSIMTDAIEVLKKEPTVIDINDDVSLFGDIHGNFESLRNFMKQNPQTSKPFIFLGNYIDYGRHGLDVLCLLLTCKTLWPSQFILLRGNHEDIVTSKSTNKSSFYNDLKRRFGDELTNLLFSVFDYLPIACVVKNEMLCVHGGICKGLNSIKQLRMIKKPYNINPYSQSIASQVVCAKPHLSNEQFNIISNNNHKNVNNQKNHQIEEHDLNEIYFEKDDLEIFLKRNGLKMLCRSHQYLSDGAMACYGGKCMTVFSCPSYKYFNNDGAILTFDKSIHYHRYSDLI